MLESGNLYSQLGEQPPIELVPVTDVRFVMVSNPLMTMQFVKDENGRIIAIEQYFLDQLSNRGEKVID